MFECWCGNFGAVNAMMMERVEKTEEKKFNISGSSSKTDMPTTSTVTEPHNQLDVHTHIQDPTYA